ncbi:replication protein A 70 kDa DNA-binding subunit B-like [Carya illinoinensis]|uniref:replication protein A 70 kDa DNA-binding subunit B-like n=1 Tax=Carya illinoinensis TaxID=32201 RepID=UPI001C7256F4|nr:replication protein A 70 kDa DNA-binding subunit B-like [Carya illinoinensis]
MIVTEKSPKRTAQNSATKYQNLVLLDSEGNRVQAVIFGKDIDLRNDTLYIYQSYYIANALVRTMDPRHQRGPYQFQWTINSKTIVEEIEEDEPALRPPEYNLVPLNELGVHIDTDAEIDILALAIHMNPPNEVNTNHGKSLIQEIYLIDPGLKLLRLTMWNRFVHDECHEISDLILAKPIILGTRIKVSSYNGLSLSSRPTSVFIVEPLLSSSVALRTWAAQNDKLLEEIIGNSFGSASSSSTDPIIKVSEIAEKLISAPAMARSTYLVRGKFRMVDFHQSFHYVSCENCNKATGYDLGENFICYSCKNAAIARARCRVYLDVYDDTTSTPVVIFGSLAEEILGCTAVDLIDRTDEIKSIHLNTFKNFDTLSFYMFFHCYRNICLILKTLQTILKIMSGS